MDYRYQAILEARSGDHECQQKHRRRFVDLKSWGMKNWIMPMKTLAIQSNGAQEDVASDVCRDHFIRHERIRAFEQVFEFITFCFHGICLFEGVAEPKSMLMSMLPCFMLCIRSEIRLHVPKVELRDLTSVGHRRDLWMANSFESCQFIAR